MSTTKERTRAAVRDTVDNVSNIKTGLEKNKKYSVDFCVKGEAYNTTIYTTSQKRAKEMLLEMFPDAKVISAKYYAEY